MNKKASRVINPGGKDAASVVSAAASWAKTRKSTHFRQFEWSDGKIDQDDLFCRRLIMPRGVTGPAIYSGAPACVIQINDASLALCNPDNNPLCFCAWDKAAREYIACISGQPVACYEKQRLGWGLGLVCSHGVMWARGVSDAITSL